RMGTGAIATPAPAKTSAIFFDLYFSAAVAPFIYKRDGSEVCPFPPCSVSRRRPWDALPRYVGAARPPRLAGAAPALCRWRGHFVAHAHGSVSPRAGAGLSVPRHGRR